MDWVLVLFVIIGFGKRAADGDSPPIVLGGAP